MKNEYGRSMIEMLGVLAIIVVLSIGGLAGYTMAMNRHRANQILDFVSRCAVAAQTFGDGYYIGAVTQSYDATNQRMVTTVANTNCGHFLPLEAEGVNGITAANFTVASRGPADTTFTVVTPSIASQDIRDALINRSNANVVVTQSAGKVTFTFKK